MERFIVRGMGGLYMLCERNAEGKFPKVVYVSAFLNRIEEELKRRIGMDAACKAGQAVS